MMGVTLDRSSMVLVHGDDVRGICAQICGQVRAMDRQVEHTLKLEVHDEFRDLRRSDWA